MQEPPNVEPRFRYPRPLHDGGTSFIAVGRKNAPTVKTVYSSVVNFAKGSVSYLSFLCFSTCIFPGQTRAQEYPNGRGLKGLLHAIFRLFFALHGFNSNILVDGSCFLRLSLCGGLGWWFGGSGKCWILIYVILDFMVFFHVLNHFVWCSGTCKADFFDLGLMEVFSDFLRYILASKPPRKLHQASNLRQTC